MSETFKPWHEKSNDAKMRLLEIIRTTDFVDQLRMFDLKYLRIVFRKIETRSVINLIHF